MPAFGPCAAGSARRRDRRAPRWPERRPESPVGSCVPCASVARLGTTSCVPGICRPVASSCSRRGGHDGEDCIVQCGESVRQAAGAEPADVGPRPTDPGGLRGVQPADRQGRLHGVRQGPPHRSARQGRRVPAHERHGPSQPDPQPTVGVPAGQSRQLRRRSRSRRGSRSSLRDAGRGSAGSSWPRRPSTKPPST